MLKCSVSQLKGLIEIIKTERELYELYISAADVSNDSGIKEKLQKCAAIHKINHNTLQKLIDEICSSFEKCTKAKHTSVSAGLQSPKAQQDRQNVLSALHGEQTLSIRYAELIGICTDEAIRSKLVFAQRECNSSLAFILDELSARGWIKDTPATQKEINLIFNQRL